MKITIEITDLETIYAIEKEAKDLGQTIEEVAKRMLDDYTDEYGPFKEINTDELKMQSYVEFRTGSKAIEALKNLSEMAKRNFNDPYAY